MLLDDPDRALALVAPVVAGEHTCGEEPRTCLSIDAELRLDRGDVDGAVTSLRRAWHLAKDDPNAADTVGACLRVFLRLGNADRAVDLLLPRLGWLDDLLTPRDRMWFAATAAHVLDRAEAVGLAPETVDGRPVREVADELGRLAVDIAAAFDARYGSTVTSATLAAAHDPARVPSEPTLPPTRLPAPGPECGSGRPARPRPVGRRARAGAGGARGPAVPRRRAAAALPGLAARPGRPPAGLDRAGMGGGVLPRPGQRAARRRPRGATVGARGRPGRGEASR